MAALSGKTKCNRQMSRKRLAEKTYARDARG